MSERRTSSAGFNRNIVECKESSEVLYDDFVADLIETSWNVKLYL